MGTETGLKEEIQERRVPKGTSPILNPDGERIYVLKKRPYVLADGPQPLGALNLGWFYSADRLRWEEITAAVHEMVDCITPKVTGKGQAYFIDKFLGEGRQAPGDRPCT